MVFCSAVQKTELTRAPGARAPDTCGKSRSLCARQHGRESLRAQPNFARNKITEANESVVRSEDPRYDIGLSIPTIFRSKISQVFFYQKLCFLFRNNPTCPRRCYSFSPDPLLDLFPVH